MRTKLLSLGSIIAYIDTDKIKTLYGLCSYVFVWDLPGSKDRNETIITEGSGSVVECLTRDRRVAGSSLTGVVSLCKSF